jgi:flagellar hook-basal body complex protein FliE
MIDPITAADAAQTLLSSPSSPAQSTPAVDFSTWLAHQVDDVNGKLMQADSQVRQLAVGETTNLHQVMISLEKAHLSLQLVVQVRNKLLDAYQNMMQMQV